MNYEHTGKSLRDLGSQGIAALRNHYILLWREEVNEDGSIPSGKNLEEILMAIRTKIHQLFTQARNEAQG